MKKQLLIDGVDVFIQGEGEHSIVMIHGWPDTYRLWDAQVAVLASGYRCVRFTLPGFDIDKPRRAYSLDETLRIFANIVETACPNQTVTLMVHDWGAVFGYQFYMRYPQLVSRIIGVDIGDASSRKFSKSLSVKAMLMICAYQGWLAIAWRVGGRVGDAMSIIMVQAMKCRSDPRYISSGMNYPYYITWTGAYGSYRKMLPFLPNCPMLFIYGKKKPFMFHTPQWAELIANKPECKVLAMASDHWLMQSAPNDFNQAVLAWLAATAPLAGCGKT